MKICKAHSIIYRYTCCCTISRPNTVCGFPPPCPVSALRPVSFTKIAYSDWLFEVSWLPPEKNKHLVESYTVFWCKSESNRDRPYQVREK